MNVMKAEDIDGHNADIDINSVLEVIIYRGNLDEFIHLLMQMF